MSTNETAPCRGCGVLSDRDVRWYEREAAVSNGVVTHAGRFQRSTCDACSSLDFTRSGVAVRACLRLLGRPETDDALFAEVLADEGVDPVEAMFSAGNPNSSPWRHVPGAFRRDLKRAYTKALLVKVERSAPPVPVPPPLDRGTEADRCLACGRAEDVGWHGFAALPLPGNGVVRGCLCASTCAPVMAHIGAWGTQFVGNCYLASKGEPVDLSLDRIPGLRPWYMLRPDEQEAVTGPWSWYAEPMPRIEEPQGITVEALAAQVASLQAELATLRGVQV